MRTPAMKKIGHSIPSLIGFLLGLYAIVFTYVALSQLTHERRLRDLDRLLTISLLDAESGQRAYLLTGEPAFLTQYEAGLKGLDIYVPVYRRALVDPESRHLCVEMSNILIMKRREMELTLSTRQNGGQAAAVAIVKNMEGHRYTESVYVHLQRIRRIEAERVAPFQLWPTPREIDIHNQWRSPSLSGLVMDLFSKVRGDWQAGL